MMLYYIFIGVVVLVYMFCANPLLFIIATALTKGAAPAVIIAFWPLPLLALLIMRLFKDG